jgi:hypothetical protein
MIMELFWFFASYVALSTLFFRFKVEAELRMPLLLAMFGFGDKLLESFGVKRVQVESPKKKSANPQ